MIPNLVFQACFKTIITLVFRASFNQRWLVNIRLVKQPNYMRLFCVVHFTRYKVQWVARSHYYKKVSGSIQSGSLYVTCVPSKVQKHAR